MSGPTQAILQQQTIADTESDWTQDLAFAQFDPSLGTLQSIGVGLTADVTGSVSVESLEAAPSTITVRESGTVAVSGPGNVPLADAIPNAFAFGSFAAYDGAADLAGTSGGVLALSNMTTAAPNAPQGSIDLGPFVGTGSVPLSVGANTSLDMTGPANLVIASQASAGASVDLQYDYIGSGPGNQGGGSTGGVFTNFVNNVDPPFFENAVTTVPQTFSFADSTTGWHNSIAVQQFDPTLGTLTSINITLTGDLATDVAAENEDPEAAGMSVTQAVTLTLALPGATEAASGSIVTSMGLGGFDSTLDFAGASGAITQHQTQVPTTTDTLSDATDLAAFTGMGTVAVPLSAVGSSILHGPGNLLARLLAQAGATATVSYTYLPGASVADVGPSTVSWTNAAGGNWLTGTNWSSSPNPPVAGDNVTIALAGAYRIDIGSGQMASANSVFIDDDEALASPPSGVTVAVNTGATLDVTQAVSLRAGTLDLAGTLIGTLTVPHPPNGGGIVFVQPIPMLIADGGTLVGALNLTDLGAELDVVGTGGLTILSPGGGNGTVYLGQFTALDFRQSGTFDNVFVSLDGGSLGAGGGASQSGDLTLGSSFDGAVVAGSSGHISADALVNRGSIIVGSGGSLALSGLTSLINDLTGTIEVDTGARLSLSVNSGASQLLNSGTIILGAASQLNIFGTEDLAGADPLAAFGTVINTGGTVLLSGDLLNSGATLKLSSLAAEFGTVQFNGTLHGGTVVADDLAVLAPNFTLDGVTWQGTMAPTGTVFTDTAYVHGGVAVRGVGGTGRGNIVLTAPGSALNVSGTITGADITIGSPGTEASIFGGTITLGQDVTLRSDAPGALALVNSNSGLGTTPLTIRGMIDAAALGGRLVLNDFGLVTSNIVNLGTVIAENGDTLQIATNLEAGNGSGVFELANGGTLEFDRTIGAGNTIVFEDSSGSTLRVDAPALFGSVPAISGFRMGNRIDLFIPAGQPPAPPIAGYGAQFANGKITVNYDASADGNHIASFTAATFAVAPGEDYSSTPFVFTPDGNDGVLMSIACFAAGTRIATPRGPVTVETLAIGDTVQLASGNTAPITWIGHRTIDCRRHPAPRNVRPVRIRRAAFGPNMPCRDLRLSPDHSVYVDGVLIPVRHLINGTSITQEPCGTIHYVHVELPNHDILLAERLPTESYLDTGDRANFANGGHAITLHPDFAAHRWEAQGCAPLVVTGPPLAAIRARLAERAAIRPKRRRA